VAASRRPEVKGISSYKPMADRTVRLRDHRLGGLEPDHLRQQRLQAGARVWKDARRQGFQAGAGAIDRSISMRDAYAAGNLHIGWGDARHAAALPGRPPEGHARHAARCTSRSDWSNGGDGIVVRDTNQDDGGCAREDDRARQNSPSPTSV